jgi:hypothetical protein
VEIEVTNEAKPQLALPLNPKEIPHIRHSHNFHQPKWDFAKG